MSTAADQPGALKHCAPKGAQAAGRTLSLHVLPSPKAKSPDGKFTFGHSKMAKWRVLSLVIVHVLIGIHVLQWLFTGMTVSPVEPSESMHTLKTGLINAGFVFFVLAILSTLIFGRFFCGWLCHVVALQDAAAWMMSKVGIRPRPFRSRLLLWVPLAVALYMFVWPVVHAYALRPLLADPTGRLPDWLGQSEPILNLRNEFLVQDFWATFPTWYVAIPFLFTIGFICVYVLGAKGFCTYGCPYGGFFAPVDLAAPGKIRVDSSKCEQCGHCTAVCTSNVRVHEEIHAFGMVVDPGCMKCLDCVSICPNDALSFGYGKPTLLAKTLPGREESAAKLKAARQARYDLNWPGEVALLALCAVLFMCYRGMLYQVPMLMAVGMAGIVCVMVALCVKLFTQANVRMQNLQLKLKGSIRPVGYAFALLTLGLLAAAAWSGTVRWCSWQGELAHAKLTTPVGFVMRPDYVPSADERAHAEKTIRYYRLAGPPSGGGFGWPLRADDLVNVAYAQAVLGQRTEAEATTKLIVETGKPSASLVATLGDMMFARGAKREDVLAMFKSTLQRHPKLMGVRQMIANDLAGRGMKTEAVALIDDGLKADPRSRDAKFIAATFFTGIDDLPRAKLMLEDAVKGHEHDADTLLRAAGGYAGMQDFKTATDLASKAAEHAHRDPMRRVGAAGMLAQLGESQKAGLEALRGVDRAREYAPWSGQASVLQGAGETLIGAGQLDDGLKLIEESLVIWSRSPWELARVGNRLIAAGMGGQGRDVNPRILALGIKALTMSIQAKPDAAALRYDLAIAYYASGLRDKALPELQAAATLAADNDFFADRYAQLLGEFGRMQEANQWAAEAKARRERALSKRDADNPTPPKP